MKMLNNIAPSITTCGTPLITICQLDFVLAITTFWAQQSSQFSTHHIIHLSVQNLSKDAIVSKKWISWHVHYFKPCRVNYVIPKLKVDKHDLNVFNLSDIIAYT